jgi:hypothetical protein
MNAPVYRRPLGCLHNPRIRAEIAALDAERDCQRIVHLLSCYEFPFDMTRALEVALFHTYGSASVARLLDRTGQFQRHGQKRYDDTNVLIALFMEAGFDGGEGAAALARMNSLHGRFRIPNDDFLFVLWTFIDFPIRWMDDFGWRPFTPHEKQAWFHYWVGVGQRMGLADIPADRAAYDAFIETYEQREMHPNEASARVARATVAVMEGWLPRPLRRFVQPVATCLVRPRLRVAAGFAEPPGWLNAAVRAALRLRAGVKRFVSVERYPTLLAGKFLRSYPKGRPPVDAIGPKVPEDG